MKNDLERLSSRARGLVCTSADDCRIDVDNYMKVTDLPDVREALAFCLKYPSQKTTKILIFKRAIKRLEKGAA